MSKGLFEIIPEKLSGTPVFAGTRVPIQNLLDYIEGDDTIKDFLDGFPPVTREQAVEVLELAKEPPLNKTLRRILCDQIHLGRPRERCLPASGPLSTRYRTRRKLSCR